MLSIDYINKKFLKMKDEKRDFNSNIGSYHSKAIRGYPKDDEVSAIRLRFPTKIPVIVDRYNRECELPYLNKRKFLVPQEITLSQFHSIIRNRLKIDRNRALFLLINNRSMVGLSKSMSEIYGQYRNDDGFLYITYSSQEVFG